MATKASTFVAFALALMLASPGDAKDVANPSVPNPLIASASNPNRAHLKRGDSGGDVSFLQNAINNHGGHLMVDGIFGRHTEKAVKNFQAQSGLETTGEVDSPTWNALAGYPVQGLETAKQAAEEAIAPAVELAKQIARLNSELDEANTQRAELQAKLDQATSELESAKQVAEDANVQRAELQAKLDQATSELESAKEAAKEANAQRAELQAKLDQATSEPESAKQEAEYYVEEGDVLMAQGKFAEALKSYRGGLVIVDILAKANPGRVALQRDASISYNKVGNVLEAEGNLADALNAYQESLAIFDRLAKADPSNTDRQHDLAISQGLVARVLAAKGDSSNALDMLQKGRAIIARLKEQSPHNNELSNDLAVFDDGIDKLKRANNLGSDPAKSERVDP